MAKTFADVSYLLWWWTGIDISCARMTFSRHSPRPVQTTNYISLFVTFTTQQNSISLCASSALASVLVQYTISKRMDYEISLCFQWMVNTRYTTNQVKASQRWT